MSKPRRSDSKYWTANRELDWVEFVKDLEEYYEAYADKKLKEYKEKVAEEIRSRKELDQWGEPVLYLSERNKALSESILIINETEV